ncbi:MAG: helix-turn-helix domain-containing protein [Acidimicrobiales bacterium]
MEIGVSDVAQHLGVSERRVLQLIEMGRLPGRQVSGRWLVEEAALPRSRLVSRPMSARIAWAFISLVSGEPVEVSDRERRRLQAKLAELSSAERPADLLRSWLRLRAERIRLAAPPSDLAELVADPRVVRSGISDPRSGMSAGREAELYAQPGQVKGLLDEYLMAPDPSAGNVWLHVCAQALKLPAPMGLVMADLADHDGPREDGRVEALIGRGSP